MIGLLAEVCLAADPGVCATRLLPGPCAEAAAVARAGDWVAAREGLVLRDAACGPVEAEIPPLAVVEMAPGVFVHTGEIALAGPGNGGDIANIGFVVGETAVAVIDAGGSRAIGERLLVAIRERTALPVRWLVLTHMHPDHVLGASVFAEAGAAIVAHAALPVALGSRAASYRAALQRQIGQAAAIGSDPVLPDATVAGRDVLDLGGRTLELEAFPVAHSDNDLGAFDSLTGTWWLGDLVVDRHVPTLEGSILGWIGLLDALGARPAARVVPGHGAASVAWPAAAVPVRGYLAALAEETRAALADGESLGTVSTDLGADLGGDWLLFDAFNAMNAGAAYRELEWE